MDYLQEFFKEYPRPTGIGAVRRSWANQIFFHQANPEQMLSACKQFRKKTINTDTQYIKSPAKWLDEQCYLDPDLQPPKLLELPKHLTSLVKYIGETKVILNCTGSELVDGILYLQTTEQMCNLFKNNHNTYLRFCEILDVKPISELKGGSDSPSMGDAPLMVLMKP